MGASPFQQTQACVGREVAGERETQPEAALVVNRCITGGEQFVEQLVAPVGDFVHLATAGVAPAHVAGLERGELGAKRSRCRDGGSVAGVDGPNCSRGFETGESGV